MKTKIKTLFASIIIIGIMFFAFVSANRVIDFIDGIYIDDFHAGSNVTASFDYYYLQGPTNVEDSPLIFRINFSSLNENYPVWRGDFKLNGHIKRCRFNLFGKCIIEKEIYFNCSEEKPLTINHPIGTETVYPENGTFYCFNKKADLNLNTHDEVFLNINSHYALWPGSYKISAETYYLTDSYPPIIKFINKTYFEQYFRDGSYIEFNVKIIEPNLKNYNAKIITENQNISFSKELIQKETYRFFQILPFDIIEDEHLLEVYAIDDFNNSALKNITIKIDKTPPKIKLIEPNENNVFSETIPIKANITDEKSGVDKDSVKLRLREIIDGSVCPEAGISIGGVSCANTGWLSIFSFNKETNLFEANINVDELNLTSGEYWLEMKASDLLKNIGYLK